MHLKIFNVFFIQPQHRGLGPTMPRAEEAQVHPHGLGHRLSVPLDAEERRRVTRRKEVGNEQRVAELDRVHLAQHSRGHAAARVEVWQHVALGHQDQFAQ